MKLSVRQMTAPEVALRISYFHQAPKEYLDLLGVDPEKLPSPDRMRADFLNEEARAVEKRSMLFLTWLGDGKPIGFSTADHIRFGEDAKIHLHVLDPENQRKGFGAACLHKSAALYFDLLKLKRLFCEPNAFNTGPNRALQKAGFKFVKTHRTIPGPINMEQTVTRWVLNKPLPQTPLSQI